MKCVTLAHRKGIFQEHAKGGKTTHTPPLAKLTPMPKFSIGSLFQDLNNLIRLLLGSMIVPTNQLKTFQRALSSLTRFLGKLSEGHLPRLLLLLLQ